MFGQVREMLTAHDNDIRKTLSLLPVALVNINLLSVSLAKTADQTSNAFRSLQTDVIDTVDDLHVRLETFMMYVKVICEVFRSVSSPKSVNNDNENTIGGIYQCYTQLWLLFSRL